MKTLGFASLMVMVLTFFLNLAITWMCISVVVSLGKASFNQCGTKYGIEKYHIDTNFFCGK